MVWPAIIGGALALGSGVTGGMMQSDAAGAQSEATEKAYNMGLWNTLYSALRQSQFRDWAQGQASDITGNYRGQLGDWLGAYPDAQQALMEGQAGAQGRMNTAAMPSFTGLPQTGVGGMPFHRDVAQGTQAIMADRLGRYGAMTAMPAYQSGMADVREGERQYMGGLDMQRLAAEQQARNLSQLYGLELGEQRLDTGARGLATDQAFHHAGMTGAGMANQGAMIAGAGAGLGALVGSFGGGK